MVGMLVLEESLEAPMDTQVGKMLTKCYFFQPKQLFLSLPYRKHLGCFRN